MMDLTAKKKFAAGLSITSNCAIIIFKLIAGAISGSISIISEAIHSLSDCLASVLTFFAVIKSSEPADKDHPFGHGRYEDMSGFIEGGLIIFAGFFIIFESIKKLLFGLSEGFDTGLGIIVMTIAVIANILVSSFLFKVAKESNSISLYADAEHLRTDVYSSAGVLAGLVLIKITNLPILDPVIAMIVAAVILKAGFSISKETLNNLLDGALPASDIKAIEDILDQYKSCGIVGWNGLKSRKSGALKNVEFTICCPGHMSLYDCHELCDRIEADIQSKLGNTNVSIHAEPECSSVSNRQV